MKAFFSQVLDEFLTPDFLEGARKKYHFAKAQFTELQAVAEKMIPRMRREAFWERKEYRKQEPIRSDSCGQPDKVYECVVMTLGHGIDDLQETYDDRGWLLQSYMTEVLASEVLLAGYQAYEQYLCTQTDWHVARYHFPGSEKAFPLELLPDLLREYEPRITCNHAFCMSPNKSVVFLSELAQGVQTCNGSICFGCTNRHCSYRTQSDPAGNEQVTKRQDRPMTYGYSRIFGRETSVLSWQDLKKGREIK